MTTQKTPKIFGIKVYPKNLTRKGSGLVLVDFIMLFLLGINILLFIFHWIYGYYRVEMIMEAQFPALHEVLYPIYLEFPFIDLIFLSIFITEFILRWLIAGIRQTYKRWYFYPFIHWYDLLGCLPFGSFRFLRILRFVALVNRLQKLEILDFRETYLYEQYRLVRSVLMESISDRVVVHVINGVKTELNSGLPITDRILREVILPNKSELVEWLSGRLRTVTQRSQRLYQEEIREYVYLRIEDAVSQNKEIQQIGQIPVLGTRVSDMLESAIQDIVFQVVNGILQDIAGRGTGRLMDELSEITLNTLLQNESEDGNTFLNDMINDMVVESLDIVKSHVEVQEWKLRERVRKEGGEWAASAIFEQAEAPTGMNKESSSNKATSKASSEVASS